MLLQLSVARDSNLVSPAQIFLLVGHLHVRVEDQAQQLWNPAFPQAFSDLTVPVSVKCLIGLTASPTRTTVAISMLHPDNRSPDPAHLPQNRSWFRSLLPPLSLPQALPFQGPQLSPLCYPSARRVPDAHQMLWHFPISGFPSRAPQLFSAHQSPLSCPPEGTPIFLTTATKPQPVTAFKNLFLLLQRDIQAVHSVRIASIMWPNLSPWHLCSPLLLPFTEQAKFLHISFWFWASCWGFPCQNLLIYETCIVRVPT